MKATKENYTFVVEKTGTGFSAYHETLSIFTTGRSTADLYTNALEALDLFLEEQRLTVSVSNLSFKVDFQKLFEYYRLINLEHLSRRIGMEASLLERYARGDEKPPTQDAQQILDGIHEVRRELMQMNVIT